jgi:putative flippase GtrA
MGIYEVHGEKLRYLVVGAVNTAFSYMLYVIALWFLNAYVAPAWSSSSWSALRYLGDHTYLVASISSWIVAVWVSTATMKYLVFRQPGHLIAQILRAYMIYAPAQALSLGILWVTVNILRLSPLIGQLVAIFVTTIFSYLGHKYFTFRVPLEVGEVPPQDMFEGRTESD